MVINSLTCYPYTKWGRRYNQFKWDNNWYAFVKSKNRQVSHCIFWFDYYILQRIGEDSKTTLNVRIRILCGMINKIPYPILNREMKIAFMECIWNIFYAMWKDYDDWYCKYILQLPF